jgi:hypothetical protein
MRLSTTGWVTNDAACDAARAVQGDPEDEASSGQRHRVLPIDIRDLQERDIRFRFPPAP